MFDSKEEDLGVFKNRQKTFYKTSTCFVYTHTYRWAYMYVCVVENFITIYKPSKD